MQPIDRMRQYVGMEAPTVEYMVDSGSIKYFADSVMDPDPLYRDEQYAKATRHGGIIAPPTFFGSATGLQGMAAGDSRSMFALPIELPDGWIGIAAGDEYECFAPIRPGMLLTRREKFIEAHEKRGRTGQLIFHTVEKTFSAQDGTILLRRKIRCVAKPAYFPAVSDALLPEEETRVSGPGSLGELTVGPLSVRYLAMFATATAEFVDIHYDADYARSMGFTGPIVQGLFKTVIVGQMLKNFTGDGTTLRRLRVEHRGIDLAGSCLTATGRLTGKSQSSPAKEIECDVWVFNQEGRTTTRGKAWLESTDALPSDNAPHDVAHI